MNRMPIETRTGAHRRKFALLAIALAGLAIASLLSFAWYTSTAESISADVGTAKVKISAGEWTFSAYNVLPGEQIPFEDALGTAMTITNESTREIIVKVEPKIEGYLKWMDAKKGNSSWASSGSDLTVEQDIYYLLYNSYTAQNQPNRYDYANAIYPDLVTVYAGLFPSSVLGAPVPGSWNQPNDVNNDAWREYYEQASSYIYGNYNDTALYLRIDDDFINAACAANLNVHHSFWNWMAARLGYGSKHFNAVAKYTQKLLVKDMIESLIGADFAEGSTTVSGNGLTVYWDGASTAFYVGISVAGQDLAFGDLALKIPAELGGGTSATFYGWLTDYGFDTSGYGASSPSYVANQNAGLDGTSKDDIPKTRLNEQEAMFRFILDAKAVQGTEAAVADVFGNDVANAFADWYAAP